MMVVTAVAFDSKMKTALQQFVEMYFDGTQHNIASTMISFPAASATFNRPILDRPLPGNVPNINFQQLPSAPQCFYGDDLIRIVDYQVLGITNDPSGKTQDQVSDCLGTVFSQCRDILAQSGIRVDRVGEPVAIPDSLHEYGVVQRVIRFRVELVRGAANWNS
jgi:hypothetical protein